MAYCKAVTDCILLSLWNYTEYVLETWPDMYSMGVWLALKTMYL